MLHEVVKIKGNLSLLQLALVYDATSSINTYTHVIENLKQRFDVLYMPSII